MATRQHITQTPRVRLQPAATPSPEARHDPPPRPLLDTGGPFRVFGGRHARSMPPEPLQPAPDTMFAPRGACLGGASGPLCICDTGHHRLLIWHHLPDADDAPCDLWIGQPDAFHEGRNANGQPNAATLNVPTGVATDGHALVVADAWNHRVLIWHAWPQQPNQPADVVLGQPDFHANAPNRGGEPDADTLYWCYGVALIDGKLVVADTGNRRLLIWQELPQYNGAPADMVLGQPHMRTRSDIADDATPGNDGNRIAMRWPHAIAFFNGHLLMADAGLSRILGWRGWPTRDGAPADLLLGQPNFEGRDHNRGQYLPSARSLNMPYGLAAASERLLVADTANSRLLGWQPPLHDDAPATALAGQHRFDEKGDNRWQRPGRDTLCWPYGISAHDDIAVIADSGNNRVLLWRLAS